MIELEVRNLVGEYCHEVTNFDVERWADLWAVDAVWSIPGSGVVSGRDAIAETFASLRGTYALCLQEVLSSVVDIVDADRASARWYIRELQWRAVDGEMVGSELLGVYDDEIARSEDGRMRFRSRNFSLLYSGPVALEGRFHRAARVNQSPS